jgi:hypothetical protein
VRGEALSGQHVKSREQGRASGFRAADQEPEVSLGELGQIFGALIAVGQDEQRALRQLPQQDGIKGFSGRG